MQEPTHILPEGTRVIVTALDPDTRGFLVVDKHLRARYQGATGTIGGYVPGHGGDVYWVRHDDGEGTIGCYGWWEFDLDGKE